jgi:hypothetical protein
MGAVKSTFEALVEQLQKVSTAAYQAGGPTDPAAGGPAGDGEQPGAGEPEHSDEEVVEGEFKEA